MRNRADRVALEVLPGRLVFFQVRQSRNAGPLQAAGQRRLRKAGDRGLQRVKTAVKGWQRLLAKGHDHRFLLEAEICLVQLLGPVGWSVTV